MKQPDRFERMMDEIGRGKGENVFAFKADVVDLLRKEHMWMRLMVQRHLAKWTDRTGPPIDAQEAYGRHCRALQCREILDQLDQRRK